MTTTLTFDEKRHRYTLDGRPVPGVTTIIGKALPKPALPYWAAKVVAETAVNTSGTLAHDVATMGADAVIKTLKRALWAERDRAAIRGTAVHALAESLAHGDDVDVNPQMAPYVQAAADFLDAHDVRPIATEARLASRTHWYAGTADLFAWVDGTPTLCDWKTSKSVHGSHFLQLAAYASADFMVQDDQEVPIPLVDRIAVVHLTPDGARLIDGPPIEAAMEAFTSVLAVSRLIPTIDSWAPAH